MIPFEANVALAYKCVQLAASIRRFDDGTTIC